jgi:hypothetical protein
MADELPESRKYDMNELYRRAFGHVRPPYPNLIQDLSGISPVGSMKAFLSTFQKESMLGTEYTFPVKLARRGELWQLPGEATIAIRGGKKLIETPVTRSQEGRKKSIATVIEEVSMQAYEVRIRGILFTDDESYPEDQVRKIREIVEQLNSVEISCNLTSLFNITRIAISDWRLFDVPGAQGQVQAYELTAKDDKEVDLLISSADN